MLGLSRRFPTFRFDFIKARKVSYAFSCVLMSFSILGFVFFGLNEGIDFKGGTMIELGFEAPPQLQTIRSEVKAVAPDTTLQTFGNDKNLLLKSSQTFKTPQERTSFVNTVIQQLTGHPSVRRVESIGPKVGMEAVHNALFATFMALLFMLIYVWVRFEWHYGLCAILALIHDSICVFGLYTLARIEFNFTSIVAILITIGYSINDTVVIYDRLRDQAHLDDPVHTLINRSINATLTRTLLTSLSTVVSLCALYFFGGPVIATYSLPILIGVIVGTYSSIFVAAPLLFSMNAPIKKRSEKSPQRPYPINMKSKSFTVIFGPTASGKSALALKLAAQLNGVIINADSRQLFRDLPILSASPTPLEQQHIVHELYDILPWSQGPFTAPDWAEKAADIIHTTSYYPIIVGGTGFYINTLLQGLPAVPPSNKYLLRLLAGLSSVRPIHHILFHLLTAWDTQLNMHKNNIVKVHRAISIALQTRQKPSEFKNKPHKRFTTHTPFIITLTPPKKHLDIRIKQRAQSMLQKGLLQEVADFYKHHRFIPPVMGFQPLIKHLEGHLSLEESMASLVQKTREYAKKQLSYARHHIKPHMTWPHVFSEKHWPDFYAALQPLLNKESL